MSNSNNKLENEFSDSFYPKINEDDYTKTMRVLRKFFTKLGYDEGFYDGVPKILSACEDWNNIATYRQGDGLLWAMPQTRQMHMEWSLMATEARHRKGLFACGVSYRSEPDTPRLGRHHRQFPLFEWETWGGIDVHDKIVDDLLVCLGFPQPDVVIHDSIAQYDGFLYPRVTFNDVIKKYNGEPGDVGHDEEQALERDFGTCVITDFTKESDPFFNMEQKPGSDVFNKRDVILGGMETIGSASRETNPLVIYKNFFKSGNGEFHRTLFRLFGEKRVKDELMDYMHLFYHSISRDEMVELYDNNEFRKLEEYIKPNAELQRSGGGIGITRLILAAKKYNLLRRW